MSAKSVLHLLVVGKAHENVVADLIAFAEVKARGVETLEDKLRVVLMIQRDIDDPQTTDGIKQLVDAQFFPLNTVIEVLIVYRQIRIRNTFLVLLKKNAECFLVILNGFQLNTFFFWLIFVD